MSAISVFTRVYIFVELGKHDRKRVEFDTDRVTGLHIKQKAGVPADYDLGLRQGHKLELVKNDETIEIKGGEQFVALPPGTIS